VIGDGRITTLNGRPVRTRPTRRLEDATLLFSDPLSPAQHQNGAAFAALAARAKLVRTWGDCYGYLLVATGWADVMCDPILSPWDIAALIPVIRGAGGVITDWQGGDPVKGTSAVVAAPELQPKVIRLLR
jgi:fructose-1,6-bisphosphatase/inositol monophosphatase family enzyme